MQSEKTANTLDTITIEDLSVKAVIGVYAWEKKVAQPLKIDIELYTDISEAAMSDNLDHALDYSDIAGQIKNFCEQNCFSLLEALADNLVALLLDNQKILGVRMQIKKPHALAADYPGAVAGVCMTRFR